MFIGCLLNETASACILSKFYSKTKIKFKMFVVFWASPLYYLKYLNILSIMTISALQNNEKN